MAGLGVLNDLKARGVEDIIITCIDGLKGFPEAINTAFPRTEVQLCIVHQIRNSIKFVASKNTKEFMADLKTVYKANIKDLVEYNLLKLDEKWGAKYPMVIKSWQSNWDNLSTYFKYSAEIRKLIYTTNPIEGFPSPGQKIYQNQRSLYKRKRSVQIDILCYIKHREEMECPIQNWALSVSQLDIFFPGRLNLKGGRN